MKTKKTFNTYSHNYSHVVLIMVVVEKNSDSSPIMIT
jgi:hypothetical protein